MKPFAALFQRTSRSTSSNTASSSPTFASETSGSEHPASAEPGSAFLKRRLGALSGLAAKLLSSKRDRAPGRNGEAIANPRNLEKYLRQHPLLKSDRLETYRAKLPLGAADGIGELSVQTLSRLPRKLASEIAVMRHTEIVRVAVIDAVWDALETNTELFEDKFNVVGKAGASTPATTRQAEQVAARYSDALPARSSAILDATRTTTDLPSVFLNANHVDLDDGRRLIASQKPLSTEIAGFHQMLLQENVGLVVDLTRSSEQERQATYAPRRTGASLRGDQGNITVTCKAKQKLKALGAVQQQLTVGNATATKRLTRLHFPGWPVPGTIDARTLVALADTVESLNPDGARPTVIHCMSGTDRTATLMAFMATRKKIANDIGNTGLCSVGQIMVTLMDVVARGRIDRGPSFLGNRDDFALLATTLVNAFSAAIYRSRRLAPPALLKTVGPGSVSQPDAVPLVHRAATAVTAFQESAASQDSTGPAQRQGEAVRTVHRCDPINVYPIDVDQTPAEPLRTPAGASLWNQLAGRLDGAPSVPVVASSEVGNNVDGVDCPLATALRVPAEVAGQATSVFFHANEVTFAQRPLVEFALDTDGARSASLGQSPLEFRLTERFLLHGLDSGKGLFQFVSTSAHRNTIRTVGNAMYAQLKREFDAAAGSPAGLVLGGRFRVTGLTEISGDTPDFRRIRLQVADVADPGRASTMLLTQAGLKFQNNVLLADQIVRAGELMDSHVATAAADPASGLQDPLAVSFAGIGRSAVLVAYREAVRRLKGVGSEEGVDALLEQIVVDGRRDRGPMFIQSSHQLEQLREAVLKQFALQGSTWRVGD